MNGLTACGGYDGNADIANCVTLGPGGWKTSHTLSQGRSGHVSLKSNTGIVLMGGDTSGTEMTTEVVGDNGSVAEGPFALEYRTR